MKQYRVIEDFIRRLKKIGIEVELSGNFPYIYLDKVNGKKVKDKFRADHGFNAFWSGIRYGDSAHFTDSKEVFKQIRKML